MPVSKEKQEELEKEMLSLNILEEDIVEKFVLGAGKGGQKMNKTSSCVYLKHLPTGIEVKCQSDRSRAMNRFLARRELCRKIKAQTLQIKTEKEQEREKIRRQKKRRSRKQQQKVLEEKKRRGSIKSLRKPPEG